MFKQTVQALVANTCSTGRKHLLGLMQFVWGCPPGGIPYRNPGIQESRNPAAGVAGRPPNDLATGNRALLLTLPVNLSLV